MRYGIFLVAILLSVLLYSCSSPQGDVAVCSRGENYNRFGVATYAVPEDFPMELPSKFSVAVEGHYTGIYNDTNYWGGSVNFGYFDFDSDNPVEVEVCYNGRIEQFEILPEISGIVAERVDTSTLRFKVNSKYSYVTVIINDNYQGDVLHLFANGLPKDVPHADGYRYDEPSRTHIFGAGYYRLRDMFPDGNLKISGSQRIYVAGGAVVDGQIWIYGGNESRLYGHGIVMNRVESDVNNNRIVVDTRATEGALVEGVVIWGRRAPGWVANYMA